MDTLKYNIKVELCFSLCYNKCVFLNIYHYINGGLK